MTFAEIMQRGKELIQKNSKEHLQTKLMALFRESDLPAEVLLDCLDAKLWEDAAKQQIALVPEESLYTMSDLSYLIEDEEERLQAKFDQLSRDKARLQQFRADHAKAEPNSPVASPAEAGTPLLQAGSESDLYEGEIKELVMYSLQEHMKSTLPGSRRRQVLEDVLEANGYTGAVEKKHETVKALLKGATGPTPKIQSVMKSLGFTYDPGTGKHGKFIYYNRPDFIITMQKTGSDYRGGMNLAQDIIDRFL